MKNENEIDLTKSIINNLPIGILRFNSENQCIFANEFVYNLLNIKTQNNNNNQHNNTIKSNTSYILDLFRNSIHPDDKLKEINICKNFLPGLQTSESISRVFNKSKNQYRWYSIRRVFLNLSDNKYNYMYIIQDIHEIREMELTLQNKQLQNETGYKEKSSFLSNVSHEIRTPLNGIIGMLTLLEDTDLSLNQQDYISMIKECSFNLMSIINDILDYSKLENGKITLDIKTMSIQECIETTNDIILSKIYEKGLEYHFKIDSNIPDILGDINRTKQIILNLLTNSVKFTDKGKINLDIYTIPLNTYILLVNNHNQHDTLRSQHNNNQHNNNQHTLQLQNNNELCFLRCDITDTGCGINHPDQDKLFKSFSQIDTNVLSKLHKGTGLGLAISKELIKLMGGFIWLDKSLPNKGSTFSFVIPFKTYKKIQNEIEYEHKDELSDLILQDAHVLIIDDNLYNRMSLTGMVTKWGMKAYAFNNAEEALYYTDLYKFDIGLIDICMPKMDGLSFAIKLREQQNSVNKNIPLVALSSLGDKVTNNMNYFKTHIIKPIKDTQLKRVCIDILQHNTNASTHSASVSNDININSINTNEYISDEYSKDQIKILIAEDSYVNQKVLSSFLKRLGYINVQTVENGQQCLDLVFKNHYDIIFMDIKMPVMEGDIALKKILEHYQYNPHTLKSYTIAVTAYSLKEDKEKYLQMGFNDYIPKPITIPELQRSLNNYIKYTLEN